MPQHAERANANQADAERGNDAAPPVVPPGYFSPPQPPPGYESPAPAAMPQPAFAMPLLAPARQLEWPLRGAGPAAAVIRFFRKFAAFNGRASRSEFWWVQLISVLLLPAAAILGAFTDMTLLASMYALFFIACIVPYLALCVRRLHDANMSGGLLALWLVPYFGAFVVLIMMILPSSNGGARFDTAAARSPLPRNVLR
ncbi:DUF805 domain-containing protein [Specibacter sp. AOP5-B1-6]|uniref:DUF805 domain-containing protein n=1 Tax=Specibacter sp. AOP5-B1-6 TaxID=3457653 RepID=UPI00402BDFF5